MHKIFIILLLLITAATQAQMVLKGKVINEKTHEPLAFVSIAIKNTTAGTTSDIDGRFELGLPAGSSSLMLSYVGFESKTLPVTDDSFLVISLKEKATELQEVVVRPAENPAHKIIRKATENKPLNNPENLNSFSYNSYNKLYSTLLDSGFATQTDDTAKFRKFILNNHLFVHESYTEKKFLKPNFSKEKVLGNHLSGIKDPFFAFIATDLQPFSFYNDFILLFDKNYLNPLSKGSTEKYDFNLIDTLYQNSDSIFVIDFEPLRGKVFDGLKGQLYITNDGYAIQSVHAQPADDKVLVESLIQQRYQKIDGHWFPVQLNSELRFKKFNFKNLKLKYVSHSYITNIKINETVEEKEFGLANVVFDPLSNKQDSSFWKKNRSGVFDVKEKNTFHVLDSAGNKLKSLQAAFKILEGLFIGRFKAGSFYIPIEYLLQTNQYENARLGLGFQTGEKISKLFMLEAYAGYGIKDRALKYGGGLQLNLSAKRDAYLKISYKQDLLEPGKYNYIKSAIATRTQDALRNWMATRMDSIEQYKLELGVRPTHFSQLSVFAQQQKRNPAYQYSYANTNETKPATTFNVFETGLQWRFAFKETYLQLGETKIVTSMSYPQINISMSHSFAGVMNGEYDFTKLETRFDHQFISKGTGKTTLQLDAGILKGDAPYPFLFNSKGSRFNQSFLNNVVVFNSFQTMGLYEFFSDQYVSLFLNQNIGRITGNRSKHFRPELSLIHNMGFGDIKNKNLHEGVEFKRMNKGYFESGLSLANLYRFSYVDLLYIGIGAGGFYRYGYYQLPKTSDNFVAKLVLTFSF